MTAARVIAAIEAAEDIVIGADDATLQRIGRQIAGMIKRLDTDELIVLNAWIDLQRYEIEAEAMALLAGGRGEA